MIQIYHNPRCGKSRNCLAFLQEKESKVEVIHYLDTPPTVEEIKIVIQKLNMQPIHLVRVKERIWIEKYKNKTQNEDAIIQALTEHPILIERPIIINGEKAIIGRNPELVTQFFLNSI